MRLAASGALPRSRTRAGAQVAGIDIAGPVSPISTLRPQHPKTLVIQANWCAPPAVGGCYKSHFSVDPDDELITNVTVTAGNAADREVIDELLDQPAAGAAANTEPVTGPVADTESGSGEPAGDTGADSGSDSARDCEPKDFEVYGDSAYADGATLDEQTARGHDMRAKVPPVRNANGYSKDQFSIDLAAGTGTCPARHTVTIRSGRRHRVARFGQFCQSCLLRADCRSSQYFCSRFAQF